MELIWDQSGTVTANQLQTLLPKENSWKPTTVLTLLKRLTQKKVLSLKKMGKVNSYTALISREQYKEIQTNAFLQTMHGGSVKSFLSALYNGKQISEKDLLELKKWLEEV